MEPTEEAEEEGPSDGTLGLSAKERSSDNLKRLAAIHIKRYQEMQAEAANGDHTTYRLHELQRYLFIWQRVEAEPIWSKLDRDARGEVFDAVFSGE